tara:strand:+ start:1434 stop:2144 length:711 start_codon:yes stop_codon:yes gene_type:complete
MNPENIPIIWKLNDVFFILLILIIVTFISLFLANFTNILVISLIFYPATIIPIFYLNFSKYKMNLNLSLKSLGFINPSKNLKVKSIILQNISPYILATYAWIVGLIFAGIWIFLINYFSISLFYPPVLEESIPEFPSNSFIIFCCIAMLIAPISEEILFRGFLLKKISSRYGPKKSILITSIIFALFHLDLGSIIPVFILGASIGWVKNKTGSLLPCIGIHIIQNSLAVILSISNI